MSNRSIEISLADQLLRLIEGGEVIVSYAVSSSANGSGEQMDSECTPRGQHRIDAKIGAGCPTNSVFIGRVATGEIYDRSLRAQHPNRDWILTRIIWLRGTEDGYNAGGNVDSKSRHIYIHGTPDDTDMSVIGSRGCIRMRNHEIEQLFNLVEEETPVNIQDQAFSDSD
ncbi:MAG: L,D-transpeptidase YbiS [Gammaproteobacteria bacterium]|jgi:L,D-transpeptidase YbiS